jgi:hypothetical protein
MGAQKTDAMGEHDKARVSSLSFFFFFHNVARFSDRTQAMQRGKKQQRRASTKLTFERYVDLDLAVLQDIGILPQKDDDNAGNSSRDAYSTNSSLQPQVLSAWAKYTKLGLNAPIGRGLYAIQVHQLLQAMDMIGKPRSDLLILQSEQLLLDPARIYRQVLEFLQLDPEFQLGQYKQIHSSKVYASGSTSKNGTTMNPATRQRLKDIFEPFNEQLATLVSLPPEWQEAWS